MWLKLLAGAACGFIIGHFVAPGYALWVILGVVAGYLLELWTTKEKSKKQSS